MDVPMGASTPSLAHTLESTPAEGSTPGTASSPVLAQSTPGSTLGSTPGLVQSTPGAGCTPALEASTPGVGSTPGLAPTPGRVSTHTPGSMRSSCLRRSTPSSQHAPALAHGATPGASTPGFAPTPVKESSPRSQSTPAWALSPASVKLQEYTPFPRGDGGLAGAVTPFPRPAPPAEALEHLNVITGRPSVRVLACGDVCGRVDVLHSKLLEIRKEVDVVFAVGCFLPPNEHEGRLKLYVGSELPRKLPVPVHFIDSGSEVFIGQAEKSKGKSGLFLQENLHFLGSCGISQVQGLNVAFLSGSYDSVAFKHQWGRGLFTGSHYTQAAIERLEKEARQLFMRGQRVDILLTSEWPDRLWSPEKRKWQMTMVDSECSSPAVSRLVARLRPQYHIFGKGDRYAVFEGHHTALGLATVRLPSEDEEELKRWWQALQVRAFGQYDLSAIIDVDEVELVPSSKRAKVEPSSKMELDGVAEEVLSSDHEDHGEDHVGDHVGEPAKTAGEAAAEPVTPTEALETSRPREMPPNDARDEQEPPEVLR